MTGSPEDALEKLFNDRRITVHPRALKDSEPEVRRQFKDLKAVGEDVKRLLRRFPQPLLAFWGRQDRGNLQIVATLPSRTVGAAQIFSLGRYDRSTCEALVSVESLALGAPVLVEETVHLLGSLGESVDQTLSAGFTVIPGMRELAAGILAVSQDPHERLSRYAGKNAREYLAAAVRWAWEFEDLGELQQLSPKLYTLVVERFLNEEFWRDKQL